MEDATPKEDHNELAAVNVECKDGSTIAFALDKMVPFKVGVDSAEDPTTTHYYVYYDSLEKFRDEDPVQSMHRSVEITPEEYKRILPIYNGYHKRVPGVDMGIPFPKPRKLEILKYILNRYHGSAIYLNNVKANGIDRMEDLPEDQWDTLINLDEPYDLVDKVSTEEISNFFLHDLLGVCGCGIPDRIKLLVVHWIDLIEHNTGMVRMIMRAPNGGAVTDMVDNTDYIWSFIYMLDDKGLLRHGNSIANPMVTELGKMVRDVFKADLGI